MPLTNVHHSALCLLRDQTTLIYNTLGKQHFQIKVISMHFFYSPANFLFGLQSSTSTILKFCSTAFLSFFLLLSFKETRKPILPLFMMYSNCPTVLQMASYIKFVQVQVNCQMERKISRNENPIKGTAKLQGKYLSFGSDGKQSLFSYFVVRENTSLGMRQIHT